MLSNERLRQFKGTTDMPKLIYDVGSHSAKGDY